MTGSPTSSRPDARPAAWARCAALLALALLAWLPSPTHAWGDEGHEIVALIAAHHLDPQVRRRVDALLSTDASGLVADQGIAAEASWADRWRTGHPETADWHYVDFEIDAAGDPGTADGGSLLERIAACRATLADPAAGTARRLFALQMLLHLVGDLHQPLHAADHHDRGGNGLRVISAGQRAGSLHHYWDSVFVARLGENAAQVAQRLVDTEGVALRSQAARGTPADWARESFLVARDQAYGDLPPAAADGIHHLDPGYVAAATATVAQRLLLAGLRLARLLDEDLRDD